MKLRAAAAPPACVLHSGAQHGERDQIERKTETGGAGAGAMSAFVPPGECPNCGEWVPARATACPNCGADSRAGWNEETYLDGVDLPGEAGGDYESTVEREFGGGKGRGWKAWFVCALAVLLALLLSGAWWLLG
jgi:hypothetical protein